MDSTSHLLELSALLQASVDIERQDRNDDRDQNEDEDKPGGSNTLLIVLIISVAVVAVAGIAGFTILKLKKPGDE